ncbi:MAG: aminotransferase class V-fold PLP-dependent enzyme, partial [Myxococcota bacterium]
VGGRAEEIALLENASAAWAQAFYALPMKPGDRILTSEAEYAANCVAFLQRRKRDGIRVEVVPSDGAGALDVAALESMIDERVRLIAVSWIPTNGGLVNPAEAIGKVAKAHGVPYLLDACQAVGQMPVDVGRLGCDFLSATGRKFLRAPRGTGFLWIRHDRLRALEPVMIDHFAAPWVELERYSLRDDARRFETWESSYALRAGLGAAVRYAQAIGLNEIQARTWGLARSLRERIRAIPGARVHDLGVTQCAIVSFSVAGLDPEAAVKALAKERVFIGVSYPSNTLIDSTRRSLPLMLRASPHYYNTEDELEALCARLERMRD